MEKEKDKTTEQLSTLLTVIFIVGIGIWIWNWSGDFAESVVKEMNAPWHERDNSAQAYTRVMNQVRREEPMLISEWPSHLERRDHVSKSNHLYRIDSWYVTDNREGSFRRVNFEATIEQLNEQEWEIHSITIHAQSH